LLTILSKSEDDIFNLVLPDGFHTPRRAEGKLMKSNSLRRDENKSPRLEKAGAFYINEII
jgi:hypothetical protein